MARPGTRLSVTIWLVFALASAPAAAQELLGTPVVLPSGDLMLGGYDLTLWGIDMLASNQQCWHGDAAWDCGAQALTALSLYTEARLVRCDVKTALDDGRLSAQCFRQRGEQFDDLARYMVDQGWARDLRDVSGGLYAYEEGDAWRQQRGMWSGRFQTPEDWKNGIERYVEYQPPVAAIVAPPVIVQSPYSSATAIVPTDTVVVIDNAGERDRDHGHDRDIQQSAAGATVPPQTTNPMQVGVPAATFPVGVPEDTLPVGHASTSSSSSDAKNNPQ